MSVLAGVVLGLPLATGLLRRLVQPPHDAARTTATSAFWLGAELVLSLVPLMLGVAFANRTAAYHDAQRTYDGALAHEDPG